MADRAKRRRLNDLTAPPGEDKVFPEDTLKRATVWDKTRWNGFCEIESEPALFNVMLREFGVRGVKIQEVVSLDEEILLFLHKPVYGLIFLFRWREDDPDKQEPSCPEGLWFANQTVSNACASVALLNIVNNIPDIELGDELESFKKFTTPFTPALRGDAVGNFKFIKTIHNSFARKMDMLNTDLQLKNDSRAKKSKTFRRSHGQGTDDSDAGFHFIAFVPALGKVWKFDGLERQPQSLGECPGEDWLGLAKPEILSRMAEYEEDQIEFSILGLVKDPLIDLTSNLAANVKSLRTAMGRLRDLGGILPGEDTTDGDVSLVDGTIFGSDPAYDLVDKAIENAIVPDVNLEKCTSTEAEVVVSTLRGLMLRQRELRTSIKEEEQARRSDEEHAAGRRYDYGAAVHTWLRILARKEMVGELLKESWQ